MEQLVNILISAASLIAMLGVLVLVHELGHYLLAKLQGFGVEAFSIGMGPLMWEKRGRKEAFQIRWLPIGGFVKLVGESGEVESDSRRDPSEIFYMRKRWERFLVLVMGATFNIIFAYLIFAGIARYGMEESILKDERPRIGWLVPGYPAQAAGVLPGDIIVSVAGRKVGNWAEAQEEIFTQTKKPYVLVVSRGGETKTFRVAPRIETVMHQEIGDIGLIRAIPSIVGGVQKGSPAEKAGLQPGDQVLALDGVPVSYWDQMQKDISSGGPGPRRVSILRAGQASELSVNPLWNEKEKRWLVGVGPKDTRWVQYKFPQCFAKAWGLVKDQSLLVYRTISKLVTRQIGMSSLSGPLGIAYVAGQAAQTTSPIYDMLFLTAIISLQLGIVNLLPIPVLDGGHIFILGIEGIIRRDLPANVKERLLQIGLGLLFLLFGAVIVLDILKFLP